MSKSAAQSVYAGALHPLASSFMRRLQARNASPRTIEVYSLSIRQLADFLDQAKLPSDVYEIDRFFGLIQEVLGSPLHTLRRHSAGHDKGN